MRLSQFFVDGNRCLSGFSGLRINIFWRSSSREGAAQTDENISVGDSGPRESVIRIKINGPSKIRDCVQGGRKGLLAPKVTASQIELIGFGVLGVASCQRFFLRIGELQSQG